MSFRAPIVGTTPDFEKNSVKPWTGRRFCVDAGVGPQVTRSGRILDGMGETLRGPDTTSHEWRRENETLLDDFLWAIYTIRRRRALKQRDDRRAQRSAYASYDSTLRTIVQEIIDRHDHGRGILFRPHPLLEELGIVLEDETVPTEFGPVHRVSPDILHQSLETILDFAISTVAELPDKADEVGYSTEALRRLAKRCDTFAKKSQVDLNQRETLDRILFAVRNDGEANPASFLRVPEALEMFANGLRRVISTTKVSRTRFDSPNPQVNLARYIVGWMETVTGRPHYRVVGTLLAGAFIAAGKPLPKWLDRIPVEMAGKRRRRKAFIQSITSPSDPTAPPTPPIP